MSWPSLLKLGPRTPEKAVSSAPPTKIARENVLNRQYLEPWIIPLRSNFVQSLNA